MLLSIYIKPAMKIKKTEFYGSFSEACHFPRDGLPEIAFLGRSNVGKSSLINALLGVKSLAKTSNTPGKTKRINFYLVNNSFYFVDLPGYGFAKVSKEMKKSWQLMIENYLKKRNSLILGVLIIDSRHLPFESDLMLHEWLQFYQLPYVIILTKIDKAKISQIKQCERALTPLINGAKLIKFSAKTKIGKKPIWQIIDRYVNPIKRSFK